MFTWIDALRYFLNGVVVASIILSLCSLAKSNKSMKDIDKRIDNIEELLKDRE